MSTTETAITDMKRELERGVPEEIEADINNRIKKLTPVINKYRKLLKEAEKQEDYDYEKLAVQLNDDLDAVYEEINK